MEDLTKVIKALNHVRESYPEVEIVCFNKEGQWQYMTSDFDSPKFNENTDKNVDISILEEASASINELPFIYQI